MGDVLQFYIDECLPPQLATALRSRGIDAIAARDVGMLKASDIDQLAYSTRERRVLVTSDRDFLQIADTGMFHAGIVYCPKKPRTIGSLAQSLVTLKLRTTASAMHNVVEFV